MLKSIKITTLLGLDYKPFDEGDYESFAGVEGEGFTADLRFQGWDFVVVMDVMQESTLLQVIDPETGDHRSFTIKEG